MQAAWNHTRGNTANMLLSCTFSNSVIILKAILKFCRVKLRKGGENSEKGVQNYDFAG